MSQRVTRRGFMQQTAAAGAGLAATSTFAKDAPKSGANEKLRLGLIGCGKRGPQLAKHVIQAPDAEIVAICDVNELHLDRQYKWLNEKPKQYRDFRKVIDDDSIDAVIVATNGHWHVLPAIYACQSGKDVYLEKPVGTRISEGWAAIKAAKKYKRIMHMGMQQRSWDHYQQAVEIIRSGKLGDISKVEVWDVNNYYPGPGSPPNGEPPNTLDWEFWLGPAPKVPYNQNRVHSHYWFFDYGGGWQLDWAVHHYDIVHWAMGVTAPKYAWGAGARYALDDNLQWPDTFQGACEYGPGPMAKNGFLMTYTCRTANARMIEGDYNGKIFYGTHAAMSVTRQGICIYGETHRDGKPVEDKVIKPRPQHEATQKHFRTFFECIRTRKPTPVPIELGHQASNPGHIMNIAWKVGRRIEWDGKKEQVVGDDEANKLVSKEYRKPWSLEI